MEKPRDIPSSNVDSSEVVAPRVTDEFTEDSRQNNNANHSLVIPSIRQKFRFGALVMAALAAVPPVITPANAEAGCVSDCAEYHPEKTGDDYQSCLMGQALVDADFLDKPSNGLECFYEAMKIKSGKRRLSEQELLDLILGERYESDIFRDLSILAYAYSKLGEGQKASDALVLLYKKDPSFYDNPIFKKLHDLRVNLERQGFDITGRLQTWESSGEQMPNWLKVFLAGVVVAGAVAVANSGDSSGESASTKKENSGSGSRSIPPVSEGVTENSIPSSIKDWIQNDLLPKTIRQKWGSTYCCPGPISTFRVDGVAKDGSMARVHVSGTVKLEGGIGRHIGGYAKVNFSGEMAFRVYGSTYRLENDDVTIGTPY